MKTLPFLLCALLSLVGCVSNKAGTSNQLTTAEQRAGWKLLFDGHSLSGWRTYGKNESPRAGWVVEDGCLKLNPQSRAGDIITLEKFEDYELEWDWRIEPKGNNGIKYLVSEKRSSPGPEYQMVDDATQDHPKRSTASLYDILPPAPDKPMKPPGEWNHSRLVVRGDTVEHWLNGKKVLQYQLGSAELKAAIAQSKFRNLDGFDEKLKGHILLTDHNDPAWYKNVKIREFRSK
jgi:hypothetical protein